MSENPIAQAILDEIRRLADRFGAVEARLGGVDDRVAGLDGRVAGLDGRVASLETRVGRLDSRMSGLEARMTNIENVVADLNGEIRTWPDMHFLASAAKSQLTHTREIKADLTDVKTRVGEIFQTMATDPEINSLREEVARFREQSLEMQVRLGALESRLGRERVEPH